MQKNKASYYFLMKNPMHIVSFILHQVLHVLLWSLTEDDYDSSF